MCGITIFLSKSKKNIIDNTLQSLNQIQNRGYDSVGIAYQNNGWQVYKNASTDNEDGFVKLSAQVKNMQSTMAIGHTRWATHGAKTDINSHPHMSMNRKIILVHNGIISNFQEIKTELETKGYTFYSETDTEVIANLLEFYSLTNSTTDAIQLAEKKMCGTWALGIINTAELDNIYITRHGSPLLLGYNDDIIICSSEIAGFNGLIYNYISLDNNDIITINSGGYHSFNTYVSKRIDLLVNDSTPAPFVHWTLKEITEQPKSILAALNNGARILNNDIILGGLTVLKNMSTIVEIEHIVVIGCGTSYHASMFAKYYFNGDEFNTIQAFDAGEFTKSDIPNTGKVLCIMCSQSGETHDLIKCIDICRKESCILMGIINVVDSHIAQNVDCGIYMNAGREVAVPSTKSFTSTLIILSLIGMWFKEKHQNLSVIKSLRNLPNSIEKLLINQQFKDKCEQIADFIISQNIRSLFILGRGKMYPISKEGALKIKEITYLHAEGYSASSLKHGPFALLDNKAATLLLIDDKNRDSLTSTYYEIVARNSKCYIITDSDNLNLNLNNGDFLWLPKLDHYQEIIFTIALQYLSYIISIKKNINPDKPRNLAKVVTVE